MTVRRVYRRILLLKSREVKALSVLKRLTAWFTGRQLQGYSDALSAATHADVSALGVAVTAEVIAPGRLAGRRRICLAEDVYIILLIQKSFSVAISHIK